MTRSGAQISIAAVLDCCVKVRLRPTWSFSSTMPQAPALPQQQNGAPAKMFWASGIYSLNGTLTSV
jgi:hypothetical protein